MCDTCGSRENVSGMNDGSGPRQICDDCYWKRLKE